MAVKMCRHRNTTGQADPSYRLRITYVEESLSFESGIYIGGSLCRLIMKLSKIYYIVLQSYYFSPVS